MQHSSLPFEVFTPKNLPSIEWELRRNLPNSSAIYFLLDACNEVLYIGRTISLKQRLNFHHHKAEFSGCQGTRIAWFMCDDSMLLAEIEAALIVHFSPPLNRHKPLPLRVDRNELISRDEDGLYTHKQVLMLLTERILAMPSTSAFARATGISIAYINDVLHERRLPGQKILDVLGMEKTKVIKYRDKAPVSS